MARSTRIQYQDAYYHVMARGNHQESIFLDDNDRRCFLATLDEVCEMTGWRVHAWVLMNNHYHLFVQTPEANLVEGMKWFQNSYTRRFNVHHKAWGRLFGDRYKAILVEGKGRYYYETLLDYIHLNPVRAGFIKLEERQSILDYPWSSIAGGYALPPEERKEWMACDEGLRSFGLPDTFEGRQKMVERLDQRVIIEAADQCGIPLTTDEIDKRRSHFSCGWYWGTESFAKNNLLIAEDVFKKQESQTHPSTKEYKAYGLQQAEILLHEGLLKANLSEEDLIRLNGSDLRKVFLALLLRKKTTVSNRWIADQLKMKSAGNVSQQLFRIDLDKVIPQLPIGLVEYGISQGFKMLVKNNSLTPSGVNDAFQAP